jgi:hypothetical protein
MRTNVNNPSFVSFLEGVSNNILSAIKLENYFKLTNEKKMSLLYVVSNMIRNAAKVKSNLTDDELKSFIVVLWKRNEVNENYEFAAVLNDIIKNFDLINELAATKATKKVTKANKTDKTTNG